MSASENFIRAFYKSIMDKRVEDILDAYRQDDATYVILEGPRLSTKGFSKIAPGWRDFCESSITLDSIEWLEGPFDLDFQDNCILSGIIRLIGSVNEDLNFDNTFRASFVLLKKNETFEIIHEHVSGALSDPYGIGDWKKKVT